MHTVPCSVSRSAADEAGLPSRSLGCVLVSLPFAQLLGWGYFKAGNEETDGLAEEVHPAQASRSKVNEDSFLQSFYGEEHSHVPYSKAGPSKLSLMGNDL